MPTGRGFDLLGGLDIVGADELTDVYYMEIDGITAGTPVAIKSAWVDPPTKLADPSTLPKGDGYSVAFDPTGTYLAVAHASSPYLTIYKRSGDTFTKLADPSTLPPNDARGVAFDPTGTYLAVAHNRFPCLTIYKGYRWGDRVAYKTDNTLASMLSFVSTGVIGIGIAADDGAYKERKKVMRIWRNDA